MAVPRDNSLDSSLTLLRDGYRFAQKRRQHHRSDIFTLRLMLQPAVCIGGEEAVRVFYDSGLFERRNALPPRIRKTLTGEAGVQTLDDAAHRHRKAMFMSLMGQASIERLTDLMAQHWRAALRRWARQRSVTLFTEVQDIFCRAACAWTGIPLQEEDVRRRAADMGAMVDGFGAVGLRHWRGRRARQRSEDWIAGIVDAVRQQKPHEADAAGALYRIAWHREPDGQLLDRRVAAVELLNLIRPIVAIASYVVFAALALHRFPEAARRLESESDEYLEYFAHEVRRFYPFTPLVGARVRSEFDWRGHRFIPGTLVILDVYGTNRDAKLWDDPEAFRPDRFRHWSGSAFDFIPQGGGDHHTGHRCAGERITIEAMKLALTFLTRFMAYDVPPQDLGYSLRRIPTGPRSGFVISRIRLPAGRGA